MSPWPGVTRPSTSSVSSRANKDVDPRVKPGGGDFLEALQSNKIIPSRNIGSD
jgi:hypothetical protein